MAHQLVPDEDRPWVSVAIAAERTPWSRAINYIDCQPVPERISPKRSGHGIRHGYGDGRRLHGGARPAASTSAGAPTSAPTPLIRRASCPAASWPAEGPAPADPVSVKDLGTAATIATSNRLLHSGPSRRRRPRNRGGARWLRCSVTLNDFDAATVPEPWPLGSDREDRCVETPMTDQCWPSASE